jgi:hypothetical protein
MGHCYGATKARSQPRRISVFSGQRSTLLPAMRYNQAVEPTSSPCSSFFGRRCLTLARPAIPCLLKSQLLSSPPRGRSLRLAGGRDSSRRARDGGRRLGRRVRRRLTNDVRVVEAEQLREREHARRQPPGHGGSGSMTMWTSRAR